MLSADYDRRRSEIALFRFRQGAHRVVADLERLLDELANDERRSWRELVGEALVAGRRVLALATRARSEDTGHVTRQLASIAAQLGESQRVVIEAMTQLLYFVPVSPGDELVLLDARAIRDGVAQLFSPLAKAPTSGPGATATPVSSVAVPAEQGARRFRVLIVEDDDAVRDVLRRHLGRMGHEVAEAENGADGLEIARRERLDLVLTDINMPGLNGIALLKALKADERTRDIPVLVISSQDDLPSVIECVEHGAEDHIAKPYDPALLGARVRAALERKRLCDQERVFRHRVAQLTAAAEAVEEQSYLPGVLDSLAAQGDELARLARVFDRMVGGLRSREDRLRRRVSQLRTEVSQVGQSIPAAQASAQSPFSSGQTVAARYQILETLGLGGMGMVYRARDTELGEDVALKVVRRDMFKEDPSIGERLKSEIRLTRRISHRNVVRAHDIGECEGTYFITMEYIPGITVEQLIDRRGRLSVESTLAIGTQLAEALAVAHEQQIMHRDIKPANLLIDHEGVLKVMDFGIARRIEAGDKLTRGGFVVGTPQYMPPEQAMGKPIDARSDLYSAGAVLYECLAGRPPFVAESLVAMITMVAEASMTPLHELVPDVPASLETLITQLLQFDPAQRPASAREMLNRLADTEHGVRREPIVFLDDIDLQIIDDLQGGTPEP